MLALIQFCVTQIGHTLESGVSSGIYYYLQLNHRSQYAAELRCSPPVNPIAAIVNPDNRVACRDVDPDEPVEIRDAAAGAHVPSSHLERLPAGRSRIDCLDVKAYARYSLDYFAKLQVVQNCGFPRT